MGTPQQVLENPEIGYQIKMIYYVSPCILKTLEEKSIGLKVMSVVVLIQMNVGWHGLHPGRWVVITVPRFGHQTAPSY